MAYTKWQKRSYIEKYNLVNYETDKRFEEDKYKCINVLWISN